MNSPMTPKTIKCKVKIGSKKENVTYKDGVYIIYTNSPARENRANISVIELLSEYLDIPKSRMSIKSGLKSKDKIVVIE